MTTSLQLSDGADWYFRMRAVLSLAFICSFSIHAPSNTKLSVEHISRHSREDSSPSYQSGILSWIFFRRKQ
ncbi:hypothetical protein AFLA_001798 [Aspergillus flavus NRRL3357]|nr:hypothetical protein AFLA_001798 [Aspergillus flavus NRRL3357]